MDWVDVHYACQTYVIDMLHDNVGWIQSDGTIVPDKNAPNDALEQYRNIQIEKMRKQILKERN